MFYVSLFQLSEDPFNQAHAHPLRLVRGGSSMTWEKGVGLQNHNIVEVRRDLCKSSGSAPLLKQDHLEQAAQFCVRCHLTQSNSYFNKEGCLYLLRKCQVSLIKLIAEEYIFSFPFYFPKCILRFIGLL